MLVPTIPTTEIEWRDYVWEAQQNVEDGATTLSSGVARKSYADLLLANFSSADASFTLLEEQVTQLSSLSEDWDSYGSPAPAGESISDARLAIGKLRVNQLVPEVVSPSAEGGVSIYFSNGKQKAFIELLNEGEVVLARYSRDDEPNVKVLRNGIQDLSDQVLGEIRHHLRARA